MAVNLRGKKGRKPKMQKGKVVILTVLIFILISLLVYLINDSLPINEVDTIATVNEVTNYTTEENKKDKKVDVSTIPNKMGNYEVIGQLVIEKISVTKNILAICNDSALDLSIAKLYGPELNEPGNFCICGHRETMLKQLSTLKKGDTLYMINKKTKTKVNYEIYKVYECSPYDLSCLDQNEDEKREVTIITCTPSGAKRVVCKARAI